MNAEAAKPATGDTVNGLRKSEQLGRQLNPRNSKPLTRVQGLLVKLQVFCMLRWVAELISSAGPR